MSRAETALLAFTRQVLLRPTRIGTLVLLGGMIAGVLVGAEGWWILLGITLFHAAACALTAMWVAVPGAGAPRQAGPPTGRVGNPARSWVVNRVPHQRRPGHDEYE
ncbi:MAG: hypothetical protein ACRDTG_24345 [Pseudonocardiaceae bacterium]